MTWIFVVYLTKNTFGVYLELDVCFGEVSMKY